MKKWEKPQVSNLGVQSTQTSTGNWICEVCKHTNFINEVAVKAHVAGYHDMIAEPGVHYNKYNGEHIS